jgi:RNA polymerase sigma-70 factor, ECF subfamily
VNRGVPHPRREEFERTALPHLGALYNLAVHLTRNPADAEDLVQESYLRAYRFFDTYEPGTNVKAWLFRIVRNTFINRYRAARVRPEEVDLEDVEAGYERMIDEAFLAQRSPTSPERIVMDGILDQEIQEALDALPEEYRSTVLLGLAEDLSYKEIAAALSIPIGTVMSRLHRGRRLLQSRLVDLARRKGILKGIPRSGQAFPSEGETKA